MEIKVYDYPPAEALEIRRQVFVEEQGFNDNVDETDRASLHILAFRDGEAVATARACPMGDGEFLVGRIAVLASQRGCGVGRVIVGAAEDAARERGGVRMLVHAQRRAYGFYLALGYESLGDEFEVQGYPHVRMVKKLI